MEESIFFDRPDCDTWALARFHHKLLLEIQESPLWEREAVCDYPLSEEQMLSFVKGYVPGWECRYAPYLLGGWFYITRSGHWLKKLRYRKEKDGLYHIVEHYSTPKMKGYDLMEVVLKDGYFFPPIDWAPSNNNG